MISYDLIKIPVKDKPQPITSKEYPPTHPKNLSELETLICDQATTAIKAYNRALNALIDYNSGIEKIVETSVEKLDRGIWKNLKQKTDRKNELLDEANMNANNAIKNLQRLEELLEDSSYESGDLTKATVKRNMQR